MEFAGGVEAGWDRCDMARFSTLTADVNGEISAPLALFREILTYEGWQPCEPCVLVASGWRQPNAVAAVVVEADGTSARPTVRIVPVGPYESGQRVRVEGEGFGPGVGSTEVGWCAFRTDQPETEVQGDPSFGHAACAYPTEGFGLVADADGRFVVDGYPLPDGGVRGFSCLDPAISCGLAWHPGEGTPPAFVTLFELRP
ncbi:MAG: hypothetical protein JJE52_02430 [Acidimicrobiia bacterium]|nr:hypothetical protein [Acidimicrobiia bacterium]